MSEHTHTETTTGRRTRQRDEARDLLKRLRIDNPKADRAALTRLYVEHVRPIIQDGDDDAIEALVILPLREWIGANIVEPRGQRKTAEERAAERAARVEEIAARDAERVEEIVTRRLLEWEMLDGRALGDLTGADCRGLSERLGVFFHVISDQIPPRAKVRNHFTELQLQALARHHKLIVP
jgi:hypothetical protein